MISSSVTRTQGPSVRCHRTCRRACEPRTDSVACPWLESPPSGFGAVQDVKTVNTLRDSGAPGQVDNGPVGCSGLAIAGDCVDAPPIPVGRYCSLSVGGRSGLLAPRRYGAPYR